MTADANSSETPIRVGLLGTARITKFAILNPARTNPRVEVVAVASRSEDKAHRYAKANRISRAYAGYQALLDDSDIEVVYNPLPNNLHAEWSIRGVRRQRSTQEGGKKADCGFHFLVTFTSTYRAFNFGASCT